MTDRRTDTYTPTANRNDLLSKRGPMRGRNRSWGLTVLRRGLLSECVCAGHGDGKRSVVVCFFRSASIVMHRCTAFVRYLFWFPGLRYKYCSRAGPSRNLGHEIYSPQFSAAVTSPVRTLQSAQSTLCTTPDTSLHSKADTVPVQHPAKRRNSAHSYLQPRKIGQAHLRICPVAFNL